MLIGVNVNCPQIGINSKLVSFGLIICVAQIEPSLLEVWSDFDCLLQITESLRDITFFGEVSAAIV